MGRDVAFRHCLGRKLCTIKTYIFQLMLRWKTKAMTIWAAVGCP
jgi:hypothetical protein